MILRVGGSCTRPASDPSALFGLGSSLSLARLAPERADPDRELQVAFLELHPHAGADLRNEQEALVGVARRTARRASPSRSPHRCRARWARGASAGPSCSGSALSTTRAAVLAVEAALDAVGRDRRRSARSSRVTQSRPPRQAARRAAKSSDPVGMQPVALDAKRLRVAVAGERVRDVGDVVDAAVGLADALDRHRAARLEHVAVLDWRPPRPRR